MDKGVIISLLVVILSILAPIIKKAKQANDPSKPAPGPRPFGMDWDWTEEEAPAQDLASAPAPDPTADLPTERRTDLASARQQGPSVRQPDLASARNTTFASDSFPGSDLREGVRATSDAPYHGMENPHSADESHKPHRPEGFNAKNAVLFSEILAPKFDEFV